MEEREYFRTTARLRARLTQVSRQTGTPRAEIIRQRLVDDLFLKRSLTSEEEAELQQIMDEQTAQKAARQERRKKKQPEE